MVCSDVAEIIMDYVRQFKRHEKIDRLYQRYKKNFIYVYSPAAPNGVEPDMYCYCQRKFSRAQRLVYLWALKVARLGYNWRYWTEKLVLETDFKGWEDEFFYTGVIWANQIFGADLSFLREIVGSSLLPASELF